MELKTFLIYNEDHCLVEFIEHKNNRLKSHYWIEGNILYKTFLQEDEAGEFYCKAMIEFDGEPKGLEYIRIQGEARVVIKDRLNIKKEVRIEDGFPFVYSIKKDFVEKLLKI